MIGNDIVDLALARKESNWKREGFLEKIFSIEEQSLILAAENPAVMVWNLWSRKEAAYKIYNRETGIRAYNPRQFECVYENMNSGMVNFKDNTYHTKTVISDEKIHTIAVTDKKDLKNVTTVSPTSKTNKTNGIPYLYKEDSIRMPISISHHGRFEAWVTIDQKLEII